MQRLLIGLICRNVAPYLSGVIDNLARYTEASGSAEHVIVWVDGHSTDGTWERLCAWAADDPSRRLLRRQDPTEILPRYLSLSAARNILLDTLRPWFGEGTLLLVLDADNVNALPVDTTAFRNACHDRQGWDALFVNQKEHYYDIWALRSEACPYDCWQRVLHHGVPRTEAIDPHQRPVSPDSPRVPVRSAFGGAGLYKTEFLDRASYRGVVFEDYDERYPLPPVSSRTREICEHVPFHDAFRAAGGTRMFIEPGWING